MLHVTLASHMLEMWRLIEATLLRQGAQLESKTSLDSSKHASCILRTTIPMLANVIYLVYNPNLLERVPSLMTKYEGIEEKWLKACINERIFPGLLSKTDDNHADEAESFVSNAKKRLDSLLQFRDHGHTKMRKIAHSDHSQC